MEMLGVYTDNMLVTLNGNNNLAYEKQAIPTTSQTTRTLKFARDFSNNENLRNIKISFDRASTKVKIKSIKIYYK